MGSTTNHASTSLPVDVSTGTPDKWRAFRDFGFQLSLASLVTSATFTLFRPEAEDTQTNFQYVLWSCLGCAVPLVYWAIISGVPKTLKPVIILLIAFVAWRSGQKSVLDFQQSYQVLNPPELRDGRYIHKALGLSYAKLPNFEEDLVPRFIATGKERSESSPDRLRKGERVQLNKMTLVRTPLVREVAPTTIIFEIANFHPVSRETFVRDVRSHEANWRSRPTTRIIRSAQGAWVAGREMVEFEVLEKRRNLSSRFVHLHEGNYLLTFVSTTMREQDRPLFDEFLKSIRFDSAE